MTLAAWQGFMNGVVGIPCGHSKKGENEMDSQLINMRDLIVFVRGGVVQCATYCGQPATIAVHDYDVSEDDASDPNVKRDVEGYLYNDLIV